jgi:hypothetical protein
MKQYKFAIRVHNRLYYLSYSSQAVKYIPNSFEISADTFSTALEGFIAINEMIDRIYKNSPRPEIVVLKHFFKENKNETPSTVNLNY